MPVQYQTRLPEFAALMRRANADDLNVMAQVHVDTSRQLAPVDTGFLRDHILQTAEATQSTLRSVVESQAPYSSAVNYGHPTRSGSWVPGQYFWEPGIEAARNALVTRAQFRLRGGTEVGREGRGGLVVTSLEEAAF